MAQPAPAKVSLSLGEAIAQSTLRNPALLASDDRIAGAQGLQQQAGLKTNPRVVFQSENNRFTAGPGYVYWRDTDSYMYGAMTIERGGKRESRVNVAAGGVSRASMERHVLEAQIRGRVAAAYWNAVAAVKIVALYTEDLQAFERVVDYNRQRVREGAAPGADLTRVEIERDRLGAALRRAQQDADLARIALFREMGQPQFPSVELTSSIDSIPAMTPVLSLDALEARAEVRLAEAVVRQQEEIVKLQQANATTDPEVQVGFKRSSGFDTLYAGVSIPLAVRNRNEGNIAAAQSELRAARNSLEALRNQIRAELEAATRDYTAKKTAIDESIAPLRVKTRDAETLALAAWREGGVDLLRFLDAVRVRIEADTLYYRSLAELQQSVVTLRLAAGLDQ